MAKNGTMSVAEFISREVERRGSNVNQLSNAAALSSSHAFKICGGALGLTAATALKLEKALGVKAEKLLEIQTANLLAEARADKALQKQLKDAYKL